MVRQRATFRIPDMHCEGCTERVSRILEQINGVRSADVSLEGKQAVVTYDAGAISPDALREAIERAGYAPSEQ